MPLLLELKDPLFEEEEYARQLVGLLDESQMLETSAVVSFELDRVWAIREACPSIPVGFITIANPFPMVRTELLGPFWPLLVVNPLYVAAAHLRGCVVCPLDPHPERRMGLYLKLGVDAVLANDPARALEAMD